jgi:hypothetical protein
MAKQCEWCLFNKIKTLLQCDNVLNFKLNHFSHDQVLKQ